MLTTDPFDDDKLREECGIFGIWGADKAASFVALGLHALQHRGQEAAGITSFDGAHFHSHRALGQVAVIVRLQPPGPAVGRSRLRGKRASQSVGAQRMGAPVGVYREAWCRRSPAPAHCVRENGCRKDFR